MKNLIFAVRSFAETPTGDFPTFAASRLPLGQNPVLGDRGRDTGHPVPFDSTASPFGGKGMMSRHRQIEEGGTGNLFFCLFTIAFTLIGCGEGSVARLMPDFSISVSPSSVSADVGTTTSPVTISVSAQSGFSGATSPSPQTRSTSKRSRCSGCPISTVEVRTNRSAATCWWSRP